MRWYTLAPLLKTVPPRKRGKLHPGVGETLVQAGKEQIPEEKSPEPPKRGSGGKGESHFREESEHGSDPEKEKKSKR